MKNVLTMLLAGMVIIGSTFAFAEDVYVTKNGKKYHKADCLLVKSKGAQPIAMEEALKKSLKPCRKCFGSTDVAKADNSAAKEVPANPTVN